MRDDTTLPNEVSITTESATAHASETPEQKAKRERDEQVLAIARKQFRAWSGRLDHFREDARDDTKFRAGSRGRVSYQWPQGVQQEREADGRPCLTINRVPGFIRLVTNQQRQANLRIRVNPVDNHGDPEVAEVLQGIIRNIETTSFADQAYTKAGDKQAEIGLGFFRLKTEWAEPENDRSFRQRIKIKGVKNPLNVVVAPAEEPDWSDAQGAFYFTDLDRDEYRERYDRDPPSSDVFSGTDDAYIAEWFPNGKVRIAEYFNRETKPGTRKRIAILSTGEVIDYDEKKPPTLPDGVTVKNTRYVQAQQMVWRTIDALNILEESVWGAPSQPFIPVIGEEENVDGEVTFKGVTRDGKGQAMAYNVFVSGLTEQVGMGVKAPVVGYRGQFGKPGEPLRKSWEMANKKPLAFLEVEPMTIDEKPAPLPQRNVFEPPMEGTILAIKQIDEDLKSTMGFRDASLAERGPQESGKAIALRQQQDQLGQSHYLYNLRFALAAAGKQLIALIRTVYDEPQIVRILGNSETPKKVMVFVGQKMDPRNEEYLQTHPGPEPLEMDDGSTVPPGGKIPFQLPEGVSGIFDLGVGEYDVETNASPDPGTRRQEEQATVGELLKGMPPEIGVKFLDLYFALFDSAVGRQMAERAKELFPPPEEQDANAMPPQAQAMMAQMQGQMQQLMAAYQEAQQELQSEKTKYQTQLTIAREKNATQVRIAAAEIKAEAAAERLEDQHEEHMLQLEQKFELLHTRIQQLHDTMLSKFGHVDAQDARMHASEEKAKDRGNTAVMEARRQSFERGNLERQAQAQTEKKPAPKKSGAKR